MRASACAPKFTFKVERFNAGGSMSPGKQSALSSTPYISGAGFPNPACVHFDTLTP